MEHSCLARVVKKGEGCIIVNCTVTPLKNKILYYEKSCSHTAKYRRSSAGNGELCCSFFCLVSPSLQFPSLRVMERKGKEHT